MDNHALSISDDDWQHMQNELENYQKAKFWRDFTWHGSRMAVIDRTRFAEIVLSDDDWRAIKTGGGNPSDETSVGCTGGSYITPLYHVSRAQRGASDH